jgi:hypothetical protein
LAIFLCTLVGSAFHQWYPSLFTPENCLGAVNASTIVLLNIFVWLIAVTPTSLMLSVSVESATSDIIILANQSVSVHSSLGLLLMDQFTKTSFFISGDFAFEFEMDVAVLSKRNKIAYLINIYFGDKKGLGITPTPHILKQTHFK